MGHDGRDERYVINVNSSHHQRHPNQVLVPLSLSSAPLIILVLCRVSSTLDSSLGKSCLVDGSPETCWTSQQVHITSILRHTCLTEDINLGSSAIHPADLFVSSHSQTDFANFSRRFRWHHLRGDHPISRCYWLARAHTDLS